MVDQALREVLRKKIHAQQRQRHLGKEKFAAELATKTSPDYMQEITSLLENNNNTQQKKLTRKQKKALRKKVKKLTDKTKVADNKTVEKLVAQVDTTNVTTTIDQTTGKERPRFRCASP